MKVDPPTAKPKVAIIGTVDVDARIPLMKGLSESFSVCGLGTEGSLSTVFAGAGFPYYTYEMSRRASGISDMRAFFRLVSLFKRIRPDIAHAFDTKPCVWGRLAARRAGVPVVIGTITGLGDLYVNPGVRNRVVRCVYEQLQKSASHESDMTFFYNQDDWNEMTSARIAPVQKSKIIPGSGISLAAFNPDNHSHSEKETIRKEFGVQQDDILITMISRVCRSKGVLELAKATEAARLVNPKLRVLLVGSIDFNSRDALSSAEIEYVRRSLQWTGARRDIAIILAASDASVLPTYREGIPRALMEAAAMGLPLIATNVPGCREVVQDGKNGYLVPARDVDGLVSALLKISASEADRKNYGDHSRALSQEHFDVAVISRRYSEVYFNLLLKPRNIRRSW